MIPPEPFSLLAWVANMNEKSFFLFYMFLRLTQYLKNYHTAYYFKYDIRNPDVKTFQNHSQVLKFGALVIL